jgi:hypothetical protein
LREYLVRRTGAFYEADVLLDGKQIAKLGRGEKFTYRVDRITGGNCYVLDPRVDGRIRPFSMLAYEEETSSSINQEKKIALKIINNLFSHDGKMYIMKHVSEGSYPKKHMLGSKHICRLVNFPFDKPEEVDVATSERLGRHRGIKVGEMSGLGITGHKVTLEDELEDIGLPLAVSSYLIYASG